MSGNIIRFDTYGLKPFVNEPIATFIDIGANVGTVSLQARVLFSKARIVAFEPGPIAFDLLKKWEPWGVECHQLALGDGTPLAFMARRHLGMCRAVHKSEPWWDDKVPMVPSLSLPAIAERWPLVEPYIIKVDCEGGERFMLRDPACVPIIRKCRHLAMELHFPFGGTGSEWDAWFAQFADTHTLSLLTWGNVNGPEKWARYVKVIDGIAHKTRGRCEVTLTRR